MLNQIRTILSVIIITALLLGSGLPFGGQPAGAADGEGEDLPPLELPEKGNPKLDSQLNQLVSAQTSRRAASSFAQESNIELVDDNVRVIVESLPDQVDAAVKTASASGVVETTYRNLLQVVMPVSQLTALADTPGIRFVRLPWYPLAADNVSEGVALINADEWQTASYNGTGVKVAILDGGFTGYADLLGTELPASVTTQSFYAGSDIEGYSAHGTACAEIVYDIAPDADFYLVNFGTDVEWGNAVDWLIAQGVDVISHSMVWFPGGPGDGTGPITDVVDTARAAGILWSQAMGNYAEKHWQGDFVDNYYDNDWHEFSGTDETDNITVNYGDAIIVFLKWDDTWGASSNDYDLYLYDYDFGDPVWGSINPQEGSDDPVEWFSYTATYSGVYHIAIHRYSATETVNFHLFSTSHVLQWQVASSSLAIPADSPNAMSVGAVFWNNPTTLEPFSSQGPTEDNRIKPDLVAPDGVSTATYGASDFYGTSASAPHVAGAAALVKECYPSYTPAQIQSFLEGRAFDLGDSGKDNLFGYGRLDLGSVPPTMEAIIEAEEQYYNTAPIFSNFGFDDDEALDDGWHQMDSYSSGNWTALFTNNATPSWDNDNWAIPDFGGLSEGSHTIYFKASDNASNVVGDYGEWNWQFYKDTTPPTDPTSVNSTSHTTSVWSSDNTVDISWTDATDNLSDLDGYSILWNTDNATAIPDTNKDIEEGVQSANSTALADGNSHYFHIRSKDNVGNWQSTVHVGPFFIDTVPPTDPTGVNSTSHTASEWSSDNTVDVTWTDATDSLSDLDGYSILWNTDNATAIPDTNKDIEEGVQSANSSALADGNSHYFHIRSVDIAGNWQSTVHFGPFFIDTVPPTNPTGVSSTSHTASVWSNDNTVDISWTDATDSLSGLDGYSILWDTNPTTIPDPTKNIEEGVQSANSSALADGNSHYFHIRSVDNMANWQSTVHVGPFFIAVNSPALSGGAVSPASGYTSATFTYSVNYTDFENDAPGSITISIDGGTSENMTARTGQDDDFTNGEIYEYITTGANLGAGTHTFQFAASDGTDNAIGDTNPHSGPTVSSPPAPPPAGGGGGGGGGGGAAGVTPVLGSTTEKGRFTEDVTAKSEDKDVELFILKDTIGRNRVGSLLTSIRIKEMEDPPAQPEQTNVVGLVYDIGPNGAYFDPPIDLTIKYDESLIPEGVAEKNLIVATWDKTASKWLEFESTVDPEVDTITAKVSHFTAFTILAPTRPASFKIVDLSITPKEVDLGEVVSISVLISNTGDLTGSHEVILKIDDVVAETKEVALDGGDSETISFSVALDTAGKHRVDISGLRGTCVVKEPPAPAAFTTGALTIYRAEVNIGESVTISVTLTNTGALTGTHEVALKIDNVVVSTKEVTLAGGTSEKVTFTTAKDVAGTYTLDVNGRLGAFTVKAPAAFTTSTLSISPNEVSIEEGVSVTSLVTNTGDLTGTHEVTLKIDNVVVASKDVTLAGGASQKVTFTTVKDVPGTYTVDVNGLLGTFTVRMPTVPAKPINWWLIGGGIIAGVVLLGLALYFLVKKRGEARSSN